MKTIKAGRILSCILAVIFLGLLGGCSFRESIESDEKQFIFGTTLSTKSIDPANGYCGWYLVRYGVGETLFKLNEEMETENWLAKGYEYLDSRTVKIEIKDNIKFHNGKDVTAESVKKSIERTIKNNKRAASSLKVEAIDTEENSIIIRTTEEKPTLINELCDPYAAIIDADSENVDVCPIGTGPFKVGQFKAAGSSTFIKNEDYWNGKVKLDSIKVMPITDADMLSMALQSGEIDAAQGLAYSMVDMFAKNDDYKISTVDTSRAIVLYFNEKNEALKKLNVRKAINSIININKENYCLSILNNQASAAVSMFPANTNYALKTSANDFTKEEALEVLKKEGYSSLNLKLVTYSSRAELPNVAQAVQHDLKSAGINVNIDIQDNIDDILGTGDFDLALYSNVTSMAGDAYGYLNSAVKTSGALNYGSYSSKEADDLINSMSIEFDGVLRDETALKVQEIVLKDEAYNFIAHMKMSFVMKKNVTGLDPHSTDYYQFDADTDIEQVN